MQVRGRVRADEGQDEKYSLKDGMTGLIRDHADTKSITDDAQHFSRNQKGIDHVKDPAQETIEGLAKRSDGTVTRITVAFALGGALMDIGAHVISATFMKGVGISMLWGLWIPLCFLTIPPIHYLCRHIQNLQNRIAALESQLGERRAS